MHTSSVARLIHRHLRSSVAAVWKRNNKPEDSGMDSICAVGSCYFVRDFEEHRYISVYVISTGKRGVRGGRKI